jgi:hypothetical protein
MAYANDVCRYPARPAYNPSPLAQAVASNIAPLEAPRYALGELCAGESSVTHQFVSPEGQRLVVAVEGTEVKVCMRSWNSRSRHGGF